jgi:hypothetical protein
MPLALALVIQEVVGLSLKAGIMVQNILSLETLDCRDAARIDVIGVPLVYGIIFTAILAMPKFSWGFPLAPSIFEMSLDEVLVLIHQSRPQKSLSTSPSA